MECLITFYTNEWKEQFDLQGHMHQQILSLSDIDSVRDLLDRAYQFEVLYYPDDRACEDYVMIPQYMFLILTKHIEIFRNMYTSGMPRYHKIGEIIPISQHEHDAWVNRLRPKEANSPFMQRIYNTSYVVVCRTAPSDRTE